MKKIILFFISILVGTTGFAESIEAGEIHLGNHAGDHAIYPDCREEFTIPMADAIMFGTYAKIILVRPFEKITKTDLCRIGVSNGLPYKLTYSCYNGEEKHCGKCGTCYERIEAFKDSGFTDPTDYANS